MTYIDIIWRTLNLKKACNWHHKRLSFRSCCVEEVRKISIVIFSNIFACLCCLIVISGPMHIICFSLNKSVKVVSKVYKNLLCMTFLRNCSDHSVYASRQCEMALRCNTVSVSHWLGAYTERSMKMAGVTRHINLRINSLWVALLSLILLLGCSSRDICMYNVIDIIYDMPYTVLVFFFCRWVSFLLSFCSVSLVCFVLWFPRHLWHDVHGSFLRNKCIV